MRLLDLFVALMLIVTSSESSVLVDAVQRGQTVRLSGRVTDILGCPLEGVRVAVLSEDGKEIGATHTDGKGTYSLTVSERDILASAEEVLSAQLVGFVKEELRTFLRRGDNLWDVGLRVGQLAEPPDMSISGRVLDLQGRPLQDASVSLFSVYRNQVVHQTRSNPRGEFVFQVGESEPHVITAVLPGFEADAKIAVINDKLRARVDLHLRKTNICTR